MPNSWHSSAKGCRLWRERCLKKPMHHRMPRLPSVLARFLRLMVDWLVRSTLVDTTLAIPARDQAEKGGDQAKSQHLDSTACTTGGGKRCAHLTGSWKARMRNLRSWRNRSKIGDGQSRLLVNAPFRLCFRLEEPDKEEETEGQRFSSPSGDHEVPSTVSADDQLSAGQAANWYVRYLLQLVDDPSLLLPIQEAWATKGRMASLLKRRGGKVQEYALAALGQAAGISVEIEQSLQGSLSGGYEAYHRRCACIPH